MADGKLPDSLEGFLYPDTYKLNEEQPLLDQLITLQLQTFNQKVWTDFASDIEQFSARAKSEHDVTLSRYDVITLASVVEKEERNKKNKSTVAGIFMHRLDLGMKLGADVTLCYGLKEPYETCTPAVINRGIYDKNNIFNTRERAGIPPQPIANPSAETFKATLNYVKTDYLFYLHGNDGQIHYGKTNNEHVKNKNKYLK